MPLHLLPLAWKLRKTARLVGDLHALSTGSPAVIGRHWTNKLIARTLYRATRGLFLRR